MLEDSHRRQIEATVGRPLTAAERVECAALDALSDEQLSVGRLLAARQGVLCLKYLQAIVPDAPLRVAAQFMDQVLVYGDDARLWRPR